MRGSCPRVQHVLELLHFTRWLLRKGWAPPALRLWALGAWLPFPQGQQPAAAVSPSRLGDVSSTALFAGGSVPRHF